MRRLRRYGSDKPTAHALELVDVPTGEGLRFKVFAGREGRRKGRGAGAGGARCRVRRSMTARRLLPVRARGLRTSSERARAGARAAVPIIKFS